MPFCSANFSVLNVTVLMNFRLFWCKFQLELVKVQEITITHVYFTALTFAGSLGRCLNTWPSGQILKYLVIYLKICSNFFPSESRGRENKLLAKINRFTASHN